MNLSAFLRKLRTAKTKGYKPYLDSGEIRFDKDNQCYCPITCVAHMQVPIDTFDSIGNYKEAARAIGLDFPIAFRITHAADHNMKFLRYIYDEHECNLRKKLTAAAFARPIRSIRGNAKAGRKTNRNKKS